MWSGWISWGGLRELEMGDRGQRELQGGCLFEELPNLTPPCLRRLAREIENVIERSEATWAGAVPRPLLTSSCGDQKESTISYVDSLHPLGVRLMTSAKQRRGARDTATPSTGASGQISASIWPKTPPHNE